MEEYFQGSEPGMYMITKHNGFVSWIDSISFEKTRPHIK
jgi:hypothetical protein